MSTFSEYIQTSALDILEGFDKQEALDAGIPADKVNLWEKAHHAYFGPTNSPSKQRQAREKARRSGFSLEQLCMIERELGRIKNNRARNKARLILLGLSGNYKALLALVKQHIATPQKPPKTGIRFSKSKDRKRSMTLTHDEELIADIEHALTDGVDKDAPIMQQMLDRLIGILRGEDDTTIPRAVRRPIVLVPVDKHLDLVRGSGDEAVFTLTDGTTVTGAELIAEGYGESLEIALVHPAEGPVNLYRTKRFANDKQRDLARIANPVCPVPGCRHGADSCEIHHITSWSNGGETNVNNLTVLCRYHNQINDDRPDRTAPTKRNPGRIERLNGERVWVSPKGYPVPNIETPGATRLLFGAGCSKSAAQVAERV